MMARFATALAALLALTGAAVAHAQLEKATPGVGATVAGATEIRLVFSEGVEPKFSGVTLTAAGGAEQTLGKPSVEVGDSKVLVIKLAKPLAPGTYTVNWRAVSTDTHHSQGKFSFTVKP